MADISSNPVVDWGGMVQGQALQSAQTNQTNQQAQVTAQQAQQAQMQTQIQKARLPLIMKAISDYSDTTEPNGGQPAGQTPSPTSGSASASDTNAPDVASGVDPNSSWYDHAQIDSALRSKYFVQPVTQQEAQAIQKATFLDPDGSLGILNSVKAQRQLRIDAQTGASQANSSNLYDAMTSVAQTAPGRAMAQLAAVAPQTVKQIQASFQNDPNEDRDEDQAARSYATHVGGVAHMYTGRPTEARADGTYIDKVTGQPVIGVDKSGLSADQWANLAQAGSKLVQIDDGQGHQTWVKTYKAQGADDLGSWMMQMAAHAGVMSAQPTIGGAPKEQARAAARQAQTTVQAQTNVNNKVANTPVAGTTITNGQPDPQMSAMLADHSFDYIPPRQPFGTALSKDEQAQKDNQVSAAQQLKQTADAGIQPLQQAQTFYAAADDIMNHGGTAGKWSSVLGKAAAWLPGVQAPAATNIQELAKYLSNAALQAGKSMFPKMTDKSQSTLLNVLNPNATMTDNAVRAMIQNGQLMTKYSLDSAQRIGAYLQSGKDATRFNAANAKYFPEPDFVVAGKNNAAPNKTSAAPKYSPAQIQAWATAHKVDLTKAQQFFGAQ
jgi:hypothetical protein